MKIRTRLSIIISLASSLILVVFGATIYFFVASHEERDFQNQLKGRIAITEQFFLKKTSFSFDKYEEIRTQFSQRLPQETEEVIEIKKNKLVVFKHPYPERVKNQLLKNKTFSFRQKNLQGESKLFFVNGKYYLIVVTAIDEVGIQTLSFLRNRIIFLILLGIPLIFAVSFVVTHWFLLPISKKIQHANTIGASNLSQRLKVINPKDEIGKMAIAFNRMLDRLEIAFNTKKLFISNASHEIRNPLTAIMGEAEIAISKVRSVGEYQASLNKILAEADTLNSTVNNLLQLSKLAGSEESGVSYTIFKFDDFLLKTRKAYNYLNPNNQVDIQIEKNNFLISGNKNLLKTTIINLLDNACKYSFNRPIKVRLTKKNNYLNLSIKDHGIGIKEVDIEKITEPFYRGNNIRKIKGTGIGLSLCSKIINIHKGTLDIKSQLNIGTQVTVKLPLYSDIAQV